MAFHMGIKIKGIEGESAKDGFKDHCDVLAWSWGMSQTGTMAFGGGGGAGIANVQDLSFTKFIDKATPKLHQHCLDGKHIDEAVLVMKKAGGKQEDYLKITLNTLLISSVSTGGSGGEDSLTENCTMNFSKVKLEYFGQDDKGATKKVGEYTWDVKKGKK